MSTPDPSTRRAGGAFIALTVLGGALIGVAAGQPSFGVVIGTAVGIVIALALWLRDRR